MFGPSWSTVLGCTRVTIYLQKHTGQQGLFCFRKPSEVTAVRNIFSSPCCQWAVSFRKVHSPLFLILPFLSLHWIGRFHLQLAECYLWIRKHFGISYPLDSHTYPPQAPTRLNREICHVHSQAKLQVSLEDIHWPLLGKLNLKLLDEYFTELWFTKIPIISFW